VKNAIAIICKTTSVTFADFVHATFFGRNDGKFCLKVIIQYNYLSYSYTDYRRVGLYIYFLILPYKAYGGIQQQNLTKY